METPNLSLPYLMPSQAQKHITHNEALRVLDALAQIAVTSRTRAEPPEPARDGERYIPAGAGAGEWHGRGGALASFEDGAWTFRQPRAGWLAYVEDESAFVVHDGEQWRPLTPLLSVEKLGVNATADATNRLAVKSDATLFDHDGDDHRMKLNKATSGDTASLLFQSGYVGRAEIGLAGSDAVSLKVSTDGVAWREALRADPTTGDIVMGGLRLSREVQLNLLPDSGRFSGNDSNAVLAGGDIVFHAPSYLTPYGSTVFSSHGKFIYDNTDFGGSGGVLDSQVRALVEWLRPPPMDRRYGAEWLAMRVDAGTPLAEMQSFGGKSYGLPLTSLSVAMPGRYSVGYYVNVIAGEVLITPERAVRAARNGVPVDAPFELTASDGWQFICLQQVPNSAGYNYRFLQLLATSGSTFLLAMPKVVPGHVDLDPMGGVLMNARLFG